MSTPAFETLRHAAKAAHDTHADLRAFTPFATDLRPSPYSAYHVPAADLMQRDADMLGAPDPLAQAFLKAGPDAQWRETYKNTDIGDDFMTRFACYCLVGLGGPWISDQMSGYVVYMPPNLHYPWHHHPAEEMYLVLAGQAQFFREGDAPETLQAGDTSFHASNQPHAMETGAHSVMAYVTWRNNLGTPPVLTRREVS